MPTSRRSKRSTMPAKTTRDPGWRRWTREEDFEERVAEARVWFGEARDELKASQSELDERKRELILKQADIKKAQEAAKELAAKDEAARLQQQASLDTQEEDLAAREQALAATLHGKDEEIEKTVAQRTQELE